MPVNDPGPPEAADDEPPAHQRAHPAPDHEDPKQPAQRVQHQVQHALAGGVGDEEGLHAHGGVQGGAGWAGDDPEGSRAAASAAGAAGQGQA